MSPVPDMLTVSELAAALKTSKRTVYRRPYRYVDTPGGRLYYADDVRLYLALNTVQPK